MVLYHSWRVIKGKDAIGLYHLFKLHSCYILHINPHWDSLLTKAIPAATVGRQKELVYILSECTAIPALACRRNWTRILISERKVLVSIPGRVEFYHTSILGFVGWLDLTVPIYRSPQSWTWGFFYLQTLLKLNFTFVFSFSVIKSVRQLSAPLLFQRF